MNTSATLRAEYLKARKLFGDRSSLLIVVFLLLSSIPSLPTILHELFVVQPFTIMIIQALAAYAFESLISRLKSTAPIALKKFESALEKEGGYLVYDNIQSTTKSPLFVTWNVIDNKNDDHHELRGCIGTFQPLVLGQGTKEYAIIAALNDHRFSPISLNEMPTLECAVTVLSDFEPIDDPLNWTVGKHGVKALFTSRRTKHQYSATFLPEVAEECGWDQATTLDYLADKAGCVRDDCDVQVTRYKGLKGKVSYAKYMEIRNQIGE